jgi:hypothetical protein
MTQGDYLNRTGAQKLTDVPSWLLGVLNDDLNRLSSS